MKYQRWAFFLGGGGCWFFFFILSVIFHDRKMLHNYFDKRFEHVYLSAARQYNLYPLIISKLCK